MSNSPSAPPTDAVMIASISKRVSTDISLMIGQDLRLENPRIVRTHTRAVGTGQVHISFKLSIRPPGGIKKYGTLLMPLPEAMTMASLLLMIPKELVASRRKDQAPDGNAKDAMLEIGNMIGGATNTALAELGLTGWSARSEGCQGVRADVPPAFLYEDGQELVVTRFRSQIEPFPNFEIILMLPSFT